MSMDVEGTNPRDNMATLGADGASNRAKVAPGRVNQLKEGSSVPAYTTYKDFDVFSGGQGLKQEEYMKATFHSSEMTEGDASFRSKAELMQDNAGSLLKESRRFRTSEDIGEENDVKEQSKEAAL